MLDTNSYITFSLANANIKLKILVDTYRRESKPQQKEDGSSLFLVRVHRYDLTYRYTGRQTKNRQIQRESDTQTDKQALI